jgi:tetratricopeptide (TPR) repeat protein
LRRLHQRVGEGLETAWGGRTAEVASELAAHFERSRDVDRAVRYRAEAAAQARSRSAYREARLHLEAALELARAQPETAERRAREIALLQDFGITLFAINGYGDEDGARAFVRMRELAERLDGGRSLFQAMQGELIVHTMRAELTVARALGEELLVIAEQLGDHAETANVETVLAATLYNLAELGAALHHAERAQQIFDPALPPLPVDVGITSAIMAGSIHGYQGRIRLARDFNRKALARGERLDTPFSRAFATNHAAGVCMLIDDVPGARALATEALELARECGLEALRVTAEMFLGWCDVEDGRAEEGLAAFRRAFREYVATGQRYGTTSFSMILARSHLLAGDVAGARRVAEDSLAFASETGERIYEPEFHRVLGECLLAGTPTRGEKAAAVEHLERARAIAAERDGLLFELRAVTSLCRVRKSARVRLAELAARFDTADDCPDLRKANALLAMRR